jgi:membrane protein
LRQLFAAGVATGGCITRLGVGSAFSFRPGHVRPAELWPGPGVVIALVSFLVGLGVCLHGGAVFGRMWNERQTDKAQLDSPTGHD